MKPNHVRLLRAGFDASRFSAQCSVYWPSGFGGAGRFVRSFSRHQTSTTVTTAQAEASPAISTAASVLGAPKSFSTVTPANKDSRRPLPMPFLKPVPVGLAVQSHGGHLPHCAAHTIHIAWAVHGVFSPTLMAHSFTTHVLGSSPTTTATPNCCISKGCPQSTGV